MSKSGSFNPWLSLKAANFEFLHNLYSAQTRWEEKSFSSHSECVPEPQQAEVSSELGFAALLLSLFPEEEHPDSVRFLGSSRKGFHSSWEQPIFPPQNPKWFLSCYWGESWGTAQTHKGLAGQAFRIKPCPRPWWETPRAMKYYSLITVIIPAVSGGAACPPTSENLCFAGLMFCEKGSRPCLGNTTLFSLWAWELGGDTAATTITNRSPSSGDADIFRQFAWWQQTEGWQRWMWKVRISRIKDAWACEMLPWMCPSEVQPHFHISRWVSGSGFQGYFAISMQGLYSTVDLKPNWLGLPWTESLQAASKAREGRNLSSPAFSFCAITDHSLSAFHTLL